jgi:hypothetical protein
VTREQSGSAERSGITPAATIPATRVLSAWSARDWSDGVNINDLSPLERLLVRTENSTYEIVVLAPSTGNVLVRGGAFFPVPAPVRLSGSSMGGSFLKLRSVHVGLRVEFSTPAGSIVTSPVRSVDIAPAATDPNDIM